MDQTAQAQLQLPGAFTPAPASPAANPGGGAPKPKPKHIPPPAPKIPSEDSVLGHTLLQNGRNGFMEFRRNGKDFQLVKLKIAGDLISRNGEACEVDVSSETINLTAVGLPQGVTRYKLELAACPFTIDILNGAVLAVTDGKRCEFKAADCRVDPAGLWGQAASEIGAERAVEIERQRYRAEQSMRANFKEWLHSAGKDHMLISRIAREQAAFSSRREELCRSYARESQHGYCALIATEARSSAIAAKVLPPPDPEAEQEVAKPLKPRKRK